MAANRKLQQLVDSTLKKVDEGLSEFDDQWAKVADCSNPNQRDKYMADLKRDIKKLQRFREDIMKWYTNPEVKEKNALADSRRRIEVEMERFKAFERESKTKPFSLMGLAMGGKLDAQEQKKQEKREPLEEFVEKLALQCDEFKAEWETLNAKKKKSKDESSRIDELKKYTDWHAFHLRSLEQVLRRLDNDMIDPDDLDTVIDSLSMYLEQFEDPDYYHDDGLYEQFNLDSDAIDETYYKPTLDEADEARNSIPSVSPSTEPPKPREVPMTAAAKAKAKKQAAREIEAAQTGGPVRPDHPSQAPPKPQRPPAPTIPPPALPTPPTAPVRPAPIFPGMTSQPQTPIPPSKHTGVWKSGSDASGTGERPPPPPPPGGLGHPAVKLSTLDFSFRTRPRCEDLLSSRPYAPSNMFTHLTVDGRAVYPDRLLEVDDAKLMSKLPLDTLILIFYYREGTHAQYLAAQELKRQQWRFHKNFGIWFRRTDGGIKTINPAFEYGAYDFFDVSGDSWGVKTKADFTFEYEYLEDDLAVPRGTSKSPELAIRKSQPVIQCYIMNIPFKINPENLHGTRPRPFLPFGVSSPSGKTRQIDRSFSPSSHQSPLSGADGDREYLIHAQIRKLGDMRKAQIDFFDSKMTQLKEAEESTAHRSQELRELQTSLQQKEAYVRSQLRRLEVEKAEIMAIRDLLRAEHESITVTSSDLKSQLKKYEKILKFQGPPPLLTIKQVGNHKN